jgi:hypothetical protein
VTRILKDLFSVLFIGLVIYEVATGKVSNRSGGTIGRKAHPVAYWINAGVSIVVTLLLLFVVVSHLDSRSGRLLSESIALAEAHAKELGFMQNTIVTIPDLLRSFQCLWAWSIAR